MREPPAGVPLKITCKDRFGTFHPTRPFRFERGWWFQSLNGRDVPLEKQDGAQVVGWVPAPDMPQERSKPA